MTAQSPHQSVSRQIGHTARPRRVTLSSGEGASRRHGPVPVPLSSYHWQVLQVLAIAYPRRVMARRSRQTARSRRTQTGMDQSGKA